MGTLYIFIKFNALNCKLQKNIDYFSRRLQQLHFSIQRCTMKCEKPQQWKATYVQRTHGVPCQTSTVAGFQRTLAGCQEKPVEGLTDDDHLHRPMSFELDCLRPGPTALDWPRLCHVSQPIQRCYYHNYYLRTFFTFSYSYSYSYDRKSASVVNSSPLSGSQETNCYDNTGHK